MNHRGRWRIGAVASAIALLGSLTSLEVHALALGRISVQSALGEPLRGEIEITDINPEEASSLKVGVASAETFKAAGLDYPSAVVGLEIKLERRANGKPYFRLNTSRAITEPFVDLILEASWSSGRVTRDYTMLFDPPGLPGGTKVAPPTAPMLSRPTAPAAKPPAPDLASAPNETPAPDLASAPDEALAAQAAPPADPSAAEQAPGISDTSAEPATPPAAQSAPDATVESAEPAATPAAPARRAVPLSKSKTRKAAPAEETPTGDHKVTVKAGDTASKIAARNKPANVSLDQMLVALLRSNPGAFINGNIHTMKSGAVLDIPDTETASATPSAEAHQLIVAQSKDFNAFRRKLAEGASAAPVDGVDRKASGTLQTQVEDKAQSSRPADILTISNGALKGKSASPAEDKIAKEKAAEEAASRLAVLDKNVTDLIKLKAGSPQEASASAPAAPGSGVTVPGLASAQSAAQDASAPASAASSPASAAMNAASKPASAASAAASKPAKGKVKTPPPPAESDTLDQINQIVEENTLPLLGTAGLLAMLGGFGFLRYRLKKNKKTKSALVDSTFLESRLQPDSFFGASGGNRINTNEANPSGSSMAYTPSQIDASGDVDPVAEADVYLAYGRDEQAEDILKEALTTYPTRVAIHAKLLEIYETRRDIKTFESVAAEAFKLTQGQGTEWTEIVERGRKLDPGNPLYRFSESTPAKSELDALSAATISSVLTAEPNLAQTFAASLSSAAMDMDFLLDEPPQVSAPAPMPMPVPAPMPAPAPAPVAPQAATSPATAIPPVSTLGDLDLSLDFDLEAAAPAPAPPPAAAPAAIQEPPPEIDFLSNGLDFTPEPFSPPKPAPAPAPVSTPQPTHDDGMMEFDLDAFSLEIATPAKTPTPAPAQSQEEEDPLEIKFLLAEEFRSLGDTDGARSLADEVLSKATGPLKIKVQSFLNAL